MEADYRSVRSSERRAATNSKVAEWMKETLREHDIRMQTDLNQPALTY